MYLHIFVSYEGGNSLFFPSFYLNVMLLMSSFEIFMKLI